MYTGRLLFSLIYNSNVGQSFIFHFLNVVFLAKATKSTTCHSEYQERKGTGNKNILIAK